MLISSSTDVYSGISQVATASFGDVWGYLVLILGIVLGFLIIETLLSSIYPHRYPKDDLM